MPISLIVIMALTIGAGVFIIISGGKPKQKQEAQQQKAYIKLFEFISSFFLTEKKVAKIFNRVTMLSIYNRREAAALTAKYWLLSTGIQLGMIIASIFLFHDIISVLICIAFALIVGDILVDKQLDSSIVKVNKGLKNFISDLRQEYMRYSSVPEALSGAISRCSPVIRKPMEEIYTILTSSNSELKLQEFYESTPFRSIQTLAGVCYNIHNYGDSRDEKGQSNFIQALTLMINEVNFELEMFTKQKAKFGYIEYLPFVPVFGMPLIETYFKSIMPGTALIYNGIFGYIARMTILLSAILSYKAISGMTSVSAFKEDDRDPWVIRLLENKKFRKFIEDIMPKGRKAEKMEHKLKYVLSRMDLRQFYAKKVVMAVGTFFVALIVIICAVNLGSDFIRNSTQQLSLIATNEMEKYSAETIRNMDEQYLNSDREWSDEELKQLVKSYMPGLSDFQVLDQVKRLRDKKASLENAYFHWWYLWICFILGIVGWFGPDISLMLRKYIVETEADTDFLQLQTLTSILMNMNIDTLEMLWQLCQHSRIHKDILLYCYHNFPSNPEKELTRLQSKTPIIEFKRFIGKLMLTINDLSLKEAFSDLIIEREYIQKIREITVNSSLDRKRALCSPLSMLPLGLTILGELIVPLGILGINEFMKALSSL